MKILAIYLKELTDTLRDRRSLASGMMYVLFGPFALFLIVNAIAASTRSSALQPVTICEHSPPANALVEYLRSAGFNFAADAPVCLELPSDYEERLAAGATVRVVVRADLSTANKTVAKLETELSRYSRLLAMQRGLARGLAPSVLAPLRIERQNLNPVSAQADLIARLLIVFFVMTPFFVSMSAAADMTAGERERSSLEALLAFPVGALRIVLGKWLAVATISVAGTAICVFGGLALMDRSALPELGLRLESDLARGGAALLMLVPLCLLVAALQVAIGFWAKSFKDAQSYLMMLGFVPAISGFVLTGERLVTARQWPMGWELAALAEPLLGATAETPPFAQIFALELIAAALLLLFTATRVRSESILAPG